MSGAADWSVSSKNEEDILNIACKLISTILCNWHYLVVCQHNSWANLIWRQMCSFLGHFVVNRRYQAHVDLRTICSTYRWRCVRSWMNINSDLACVVNKLNADRFSLLCALKSVSTISVGSDVKLYYQADHVNATSYTRCCCCCCCCSTERNTSRSHASSTLDRDQPAKRRQVPLWFRSKLSSNIIESFQIFSVIHSVILK